MAGGIIPAGFSFSPPFCEQSVDAMPGATRSWQVLHSASGSRRKAWVASTSALPEHSGDLVRLYANNHQGKAGPRTSRPIPYRRMKMILTLTPRITTISSRRIRDVLISYLLVNGRRDDPRRLFFFAANL
jgi:hypothetical protein